MYSSNFGQIKLRSDFSADNSGLVTASLQSSTLNGSFSKQFNDFSYIQQSKDREFPHHRIPSTSTIFKGAIKGLELVGVKKPSTVGAGSTLYLLKKLSSAEKKAIKRQQKIVDEVISWVNELDDEDSKTYLTEFIKVISTQTRERENLLRANDNLCLIMDQIAKRESVIHQQYEELVKTGIELTKLQRRAGPCPDTQLKQDNFQSMQFAMKTANSQYVHSINTSLKDAFLNYILNLQEATLRVKDVSRAFFDHINLEAIFNHKKEAIMNDLEKEKIEFLHSAKIEEENNEENINEQESSNAGTSNQGLNGIVTKMKNRISESPLNIQKNNSLKNVLRDTSNVIPNLNSRSKNELAEFDELSLGNMDSIGNNIFGETSTNNFVTPGKLTRSMSIRSKDVWP